MTNEREFKLNELAEAAGVTPRTVRYYIAQGLLSSPGRLGPNTRYGAEHLERLRLIRQLQEERLPLAEIRELLEGRTDVPRGASLKPAGAPPPPMTAPGIVARADSWTDRSRWERIVLTPDLELHARQPRSASAERLIAELVRVARRRRD